MYVFTKLHLHNLTRNINCIPGPLAQRDVQLNGPTSLWSRVHLMWRFLEAKLDEGLSRDLEEWAESINLRTSTLPERLECSVYDGGFLKVSPISISTIYQP